MKFTLLIVFAALRSFGAGLNCPCVMQGYDTLTDTWLVNVTAASGSTIANDRNSVDILVKSLRVNALTPKITLAFPFAGVQMAASLVPVINTTGTTIVNHNFVSGDYTPTTGLKGNSTTKYLDVGKSCSGLSMLVGSAHLSFAWVQATQKQLPCQAKDGATSSFAVYPNYTGLGTTYLDGWTQAGAGRISGADTATTGYWCGTITSTTAEAIYRGNNANGFVTIATAASGGGTLQTTQNMYLFAGDIAGSPSNFEDGTGRWFSFGTGLTSADAQNLYNAVQAFNTQMGRPL